MSLTRQELLDRLRNRPVKALDIPDFGNVFVREMSVGEREQLSKQLPQDAAVKTSAVEWGIALVAATVCDETGARLLTPEDAEALHDSSQVALNKLLDAALDVNGMATKSMEQAEKNSVPTPTVASSSG